MHNHVRHSHVPIDCVVSDWSPCVGACGSKSTQTRNIITPASNGGKACPELTQICQTPPCPVDCVVSGWGPCSKSCGSGIQNRTIVKPSSNGGKDCPELSQACNTQPCAPARTYQSQSGTKGYYSWQDGNMGYFSGSVGDCQFKCDNTPNCIGFQMHGNSGCDLKNSGIYNELQLDVGDKFYYTGPSPLDLIPTTCQGQCGRLMKSPNGNCNLVAYEGGQMTVYDSNGNSKWDNNQWGQKRPSKLNMQNDGNLVMADGNGKTIWSSKTPSVGSAPHTLKVQDDCSLAIYDSQGSKTWGTK